MTVIKKLFEQLDKDEQEDFISVCNKAHMTWKDFEVLMEEEYINVGVANIMREATVVRLANSKAKHYLAGTGKAWIVDFENDLLNGFFE